MSQRSDRKRYLLPKSPEGKYWFSRHTALISFIRELADGDIGPVSNACKEVLNAEIGLDLEHITEMKSEVVSPEKNLIITDKFEKGNPSGH